MLPDKPSYEVVDAVELAQRWSVPVKLDQGTDAGPCL